jgi:hypothetical protein
MTNWVTVAPAYGRDYKSAKAAREDWDSGKDFKLLPQGCYCSKRDFDSDTKIEIRYSKLMKLTVI